MAALLDRLVAWLERRRRFKSALAYNTHNTFTYARRPTWMCPCCCSIHEHTSVSKFSGLQYPACCDFPAGGRLDRRFATAI